MRATPNDGGVRFEWAVRPHVMPDEPGQCAVHTCRSKNPGPAQTGHTAGNRQRPPTSSSVRKPLLRAPRLRLVAQMIPPARAADKGPMARWHRCCPNGRAFTSPEERVGSIPPNESIGSETIRPLSRRFGLQPARPLATLRAGSVLAGSDVICVATLSDRSTGSSAAVKLRPHPSASAGWSSIIVSSATLIAASMRAS